MEPKEFREGVFRHVRCPLEMTCIWQRSSKYTDRLGEAPYSSMFNDFLRIDVHRTLRLEADCGISVSINFRTMDDNR
jgi:hypothetical protein